MVKCWVHSCKHYNVRETCRFFSFPLEDKKREHWLELLRYDKEPGPGARICSCHFEGGVKENGPSIFAHNNETFIPHHLSPETRTSRIAEIAMEDIPSTSTDEPYPIESVVLDAHADSDVLFKVECEESDLLEHSENADVTMQAHENDKLNATSNIYIKREIEEAEIITDPEPTENMINIKNEYIDSDDMDDNVLSSEGTSKVDEIVLKNEIDEFEACDTDNIKTEFSGEIRDNRINYEVKIDDEIDASDVSNKFLSCGNCMVTYQDYCTKCDMLVCILNGNTSSNKDSTAIEDIPKDILEIRKSLASFGTFALKVIPEGVRFGPFFGSNTSESSWRIKGGKFLVAEDKSKLLNWMQYINPARNILERNLAVLQHESNLYYRTIREIQEGEELLVYFGEEYEGSLINDVEVEFVPTNVKDIEDAFVCTFCCLGFSSMIYLVNHKTICPYRITGGSLKNGKRFEEQGSLQEITSNSECSKPISFTESSRKVSVQHSLETSSRKSRIWNKRDRCSFCKQDVTNFSRHLFRKHFTEESVIKIMNSPKGSNERYELINLLRKEGNLRVYYENIIRPVQRPSLNNLNVDLIISEKFLPCKYCKGLYKKGSISRHARKCYFKHENDNSSLRYASEGQTMLAFSGSKEKFLDCPRLKTEVFNKMHADVISYNGKRDPIICQYAEDYLQNHQTPHIKNIVSNNIRELGRLLIPLKEIYNIHSMLEALKPEHFDKVVTASRIIAGYDEINKSFKTPSLAKHLRTTLLSVCSAANTLLLKKDSVLPVVHYDSALRDVHRFSELVTYNWKGDMGCLAFKDLNEKDCVKLPPFTSDIIMFKNYCHNIATNSVQKLKGNMEDVDSFEKLSEATLVLTILLNRTRVGAVQYMKLKACNESATNSNKTDWFNVLTEPEKKLMKYIKRVVIVRKGSKFVPILFPKAIQEYLDLLLDIRNKTAFVPKENTFVFALVGSSSKWIHGSAILRKYVESCGARNANMLTSSKLGKQIATVLQILNLSNLEMEEVANCFMGEAKKTHEEFYRLPEDVFQTSKVAKLLLMLEKGITKEDEEKVLNDIDIELKMWASDKSLPEKHQYIDEEQNSIENDARICKNNLALSNNQEKNKSRGAWSKQQRKILLNFFNEHIENKTPPKKAECLEVQKKHVELKDKTWAQIKVFIYNTYKNN